MFYNLGSINLDLVYQVPHFPVPGETLMSTDFRRFPGGKGLNQSVAMARAGASVVHIGACGPDADFCLQELSDAGVELAVDRTRPVSGQGVIYVDPTGENQIVLLPAANLEITPQQISQGLGAMDCQDWLVLQNETNLQVEAAKLARGLGARVAYSAAPFESQALAEILPHVDLVAMNQGESEQAMQALGSQPERWGCQALITLGSQGAKFFDGQQWFEQAAMAVAPVDTTGAGDTFFGYFLAHLDQAGPQQALNLATQASAIQITRPGAASAIPRLDELA
jgi:ribokinase